MGVLVPTEVRRQLARPPAPAGFSEVELDGLPEVVRRHLEAAIGPGTPLATSALLGMRGQLRLGRWLPFQAEQVLSPHHGFYWAARVAGLTSGFHRYLDGQGELQWKLLGVLPVTRAEGPNVARSAVGRAAGGGDVAANGPAATVRGRVGGGRRPARNGPLRSGWGCRGPAV